MFDLEKQAQIANLKRKIFKYEHNISDNKKHINKLEDYYDDIIKRKQQEENELYGKYQRYKSLEHRITGKRAASYVQHYINYFSPTNIDRILNDYDTIKIKINTKIDNLSLENKSLRKKIQKCEDEIEYLKNK